MKGVVFSKAAAADLEEIDEYTLEHFGLEQAIALRQRFEETFLALRRHPLSAPRRPQYDPAGRAFRYRVVHAAFVIVYEPAADEIRVARVIYGVQDLPSELRRTPGFE